MNAAMLVGGELQRSLPAVSVIMSLPVRRGRVHFMGGSRQEPRSGAVVRDRAPHGAGSGQGAHQLSQFQVGEGGIRQAALLFDPVAVPPAVGVRTDQA